MIDIGRRSVLLWTCGLRYVSYCIFCMIKHLQSVIILLLIYLLIVSGISIARSIGIDSDSPRLRAFSKHYSVTVTVFIFNCRIQIYLCDSLIQRWKCLSKVIQHQDKTGINNRFDKFNTFISSNWHSKSVFLNVSLRSRSAASMGWGGGMTGELYAFPIRRLEFQVHVIMSLYLYIYITKFYILNY